jgi:hypothetical protein
LLFRVQSRPCSSLKTSIPSVTGCDSQRSMFPSGGDAHLSVRFGSCESNSQLNLIERLALSVCGRFKSFCISASVDVLQRSRVSGCESLSPLTFESAPRLSSIHIDMDDFVNSPSRISIWLPASVEIVRTALLCKYTSIANWNFNSVRD